MTMTRLAKNVMSDFRDFIIETMNNVTDGNGVRGQSPHTSSPCDSSRGGSLGNSERRRSSAGE